MSNNFCPRIPAYLTGRAAKARLEKTGAKPVVVQFYAPWCSHCRQVHPEIDELQRRLCQSADVVRVNVDADEALATQYAVEGLPTVAVFKNGQVVDRMVGTSKADAYEAMVRKALS